MPGRRQDMCKTSQKNRERATRRRARFAILPCLPRFQFATGAVTGDSSCLPSWLHKTPPTPYRRRLQKAQLLSQLHWASKWILHIPFDPEILLEVRKAQRAGDSTSLRADFGVEIIGLRPGNAYHLLWKAKSLLPPTNT